MLDFKNLKKFDVQSLVNQVKSVINPAGQTPTPNPDDVVGIKIAELSILVQEVAAVNAEQTKSIQKINTLLNELFNALNTPKTEEETTSTASSEQTSEENTPKGE